MNIAVIYDSKTGNTKQAAEWIAAGMLVYSSGGERGLPYIHLGPVAVNGNMEKHNTLAHYEEYFTIFGKRFAEKTIEIFGNGSEN